MALSEVPSGGCCHNLNPVSFQNGLGHAFAAAARLIRERFNVKTFSLPRLPVATTFTLMTAVMAFAFAPFGPAFAQEGNGNVSSKHGAWSIICDVPAGASEEQCALMQNVVAEDRQEVGLSVVVLKTADNQARILRVLAPLGVILPNGLGLNIDGKDMGRALFVRCLKDGCYAEVILKDDLIDAFKNGQSATFIIFETPEEGIGIPVDLAGFGDGFEKLP